MSEESQLKIGSLVMSTGETSFTLHCDALACSDLADNRLMLASVTGAASAIAAFTASLNLKALRVVYQPTVEGFHQHYRIDRSPHGYDIKKAKLAYNTWHVLAIAREPGLMPKVSESSVWRELRSERYTTPLLRAWTPWLIEKLQTTRQLRRMKCFQCSAARLQTNTASLDKLVSEGVSSGALRIEQAHQPQEGSNGQ